jgi:hypothetical protein
MALLVSNDLWAVVEPLLPRDLPKLKGGWSVLQTARSWQASCSCCELVLSS